MMKATWIKTEGTEMQVLRKCIIGEVVRTNLASVKDILKWTDHKKLKELQAFLGLTNYYRRFIRIYAETAVSLSSFTRKDVLFLRSK